MSQEELKRLGTAILLVALVATSPYWLKDRAHQVSSYDAPWVYPGLNPTVVSQMEQSNH